MSGAVNEAFSCYVWKTNAHLDFALKSWFSKINKSFSPRMSLWFLGVVEGWCRVDPPSLCQL